MRNYFITGIGTDVGKTFVSAVFVEAFNMDYWKPVQSGEPRDTETVRRLVSKRNGVVFHPESYLLKHPMSPHAAAQLEEKHIDLEAISMPSVQNPNGLLAEGAGGVLVPLNDTNYVIDIAAKFNFSVVLVASLYLGSINHTLLTISELKRRGLRLLGVVFNGKANTSSQDIILKKTNAPCLLHILPEQSVSQDTVKHYANILQANFNKLY